MRSSHDATLCTAALLAVVQHSLWDYDSLSSFIDALAPLVRRTCLHACSLTNSATPNSISNATASDCTGLSAVSVTHVSCSCRHGALRCEPMSQPLPHDAGQVHYGAAGIRWQALVSYPASRSRGRHLRSLCRARRPQDSSMAWLSRITNHPSLERVLIVSCIGWIVWPVCSIGRDRVYHLYAALQALEPVLLPMHTEH